MTVGIIGHYKCGEHDMGEHHPENGKRLTAISDQLIRSGLDYVIRQFDANPIETYTAAAALLNKLNIVYLHIAEVDWDDAPETPASFKKAIRKAYSGIIIYAGRYDAKKAEKAILEGMADMVAFGRPFVANPDLPNRILCGHDLAAHDPNTLFGGAEKGLTDYPSFQQ